MAPKSRYWSLWLGGIPASSTHSDVRDWLWSTTGLSVAEVQMVRGPAGSTMGSAILRFNTHTSAKTALNLLQGTQVRFWHQRFTVQWSKDSAAWPMEDKAVQTDLDTVEEGVQAVTGTVEEGVQAVTGTVEQEVQTAEDDDDVPQGDGSPTEASTMKVSPTSRASSETASPATQSEEECPTVLVPPGEAGEKFRERAEVIRELASAQTEVDRVKEELKKVKEEETESCEGEASSSQPLKKVKLEHKG